MSGGRRIDDRSAWMGSSSSENPLPMSSKERSFSSADGVGELSMYEDTSEAIKSQQEANNRQAMKNRFGPGQRN